MSESALDSLAAMKKLRVADLREQLTIMGLPTTGLKSELVDRLFNALHPEQALVDDAVKTPAELESAPVQETVVNEPKSPARGLSPKKNPTPVDAGESVNSPANPQSFQELKRKRAERFGVPTPAESEPAKTVDGNAEPNSKLDVPLGSGKRKHPGGDAAPKLNLEDPDVKRRLNRFGLQMHDPNSIVAKSVASEEIKKKKDERLKRFGIVKDQQDKDVEGFQAALAARKARFGAA